MNLSKEILEYIRAEAQLKQKKAVMTLKIFSKAAVGVGEHTTGDLYKNIMDAAKELDEAGGLIEVADFLEEFILNKCVN